MRKVLVVVVPVVACAMSCLVLTVADLLHTDGVLRDGMKLIRRIKTSRLCRHITSVTMRIG